MRRPVTLNSPSNISAKRGSFARGTAPVSLQRATRKPPLMRKYDVSALQPDGSTKTSHHVALANATFEAGFSAFARGTLVQTDFGPCAVEDLLPGDRILTDEYGPTPLLWIGSMTLMPNAEITTPDHPPELTKLTRITADAFGISHPMPDFLAGPGARLLQRPLALRDIAGQGPVLTPVRDFIDGVNVIEITPPTPIALFHLALAHHATITVAGLKVETFHPGKNAGNDMGPNTRALFLSLFPHITRFSDFGSLAHPRASLSTLDALTAA